MDWLLERTSLVGVAVDTLSIELGHTQQCYVHRTLTRHNKVRGDCTVYSVLCTVYCTPATFSVRRGVCGQHGEAASQRLHRHRPAPQDRGRQWGTLQGHRQAARILHLTAVSLRRNKEVFPTLLFFY